MLLSRKLAVIYISSVFLLASVIFAQDPTISSSADPATTTVPTDDSDSTTAVQSSPVGTTADNGAGDKVTDASTASIQGQTSTSVAETTTAAVPSVGGEGTEGGSTGSNVVTQEGSADTTTADMASIAETSDDGSTSSTKNAQTTNSETITTAALIVTNPTTAPAAVTVCGVLEEEIDASSPCHSTQHTSYHRSADSTCDSDIPTDEWLLFQDKSSGSCLQIPLIAEGKCYRPGACGSEFPYYLSGNALPAENQTNSLKLCMTDSLRSNRALCCQEEITTEVHNCMDSFFVYKMTAKMNVNACGRVCLSKTAKTFYSTVDNLERLQTKFEVLTDEEKSNVVAAVVKFENKDEMLNNWEDVSKALQDELEEKLIAAGVGQEDTSSGRRKRQTQSTPIHIDILDGYPKFDEEKQEMTVIMLVHLAKVGDPVVTKEQVEAALQEMKDEELAGIKASVAGTTKLPAELSAQTNKKTPEPYTVATKGGNLWIAIIIIIAVTAFILAASLIVVWCYSFRHRRKSGTLNVYKEPLVGEDEMNNSYRPVQEVTGHVNLAMEEEPGTDKNQNNGSSKTSPAALDGDKSVEPIEDNAV